MGLSRQQQELRVKTLLLLAARSSGESGSGTPVTRRRSEPTGRLWEHQARVTWGLIEPGQFPPPERTVPAS